MSFGKPKREISDVERTARRKLELAQAAVKIAEDTRHAVFATFAPIRMDMEAILANDTADEIAENVARTRLDEVNELRDAGWTQENSAHQLCVQANAELESILAACNPEFRTALIANRAAELACSVARTALQRIEKADYKNDETKAAAIKAAWARLDAANNVRCGAFNESDFQYEDDRPDERKGTQGALHRLRKQMDDDWLFTEWAAEDAKANVDFETMKVAEKKRLEAELYKMTTAGDIQAGKWLAEIHATTLAEADAVSVARDAVTKAQHTAWDQLRTLTDSYHPGYSTGNDTKYTEIHAIKIKISELEQKYKLLDGKWLALAAADGAARELKDEQECSSNDGSSRFEF